MPVRLDALCLTEDLDVSGPSADFSLLPYVDPVTGRDLGSGLPYLSEILLPAPFEDQNLRLKAGIHLHWALPDALTRMVRDENGTQSPAAPDRWLVTRSRGGEVQGRWVVESDTVGDGDLAGVAYPVIEGDPPSPAGRPYRHLGRKVPLAAWDPSGHGTDRLSRLSVTGYGEPAFAAFYPNCHSVFGFHDPDYRGTPPDDLTYEVLGWYGREDGDELVRVLLADPAAPTWQEKVAGRLRWSVPAGAERPERMVCAGRLAFAPVAERTGSPPSTADTGVYVGNTATEALAAHLGAVLLGVEPDQAENLLEALVYADELESAALDLSIRLAESRHTASFVPADGGTRWTLRRRDETEAERGGPITAAQRRNRERLTLPPGLAPLLDRLNDAQDRYDRTQRTLTGLRRQLYADWYKYMLCAYPPETDREGYPGLDETAFFLRRGVQKIAELAAKGGTYPPTGPGDSYAHRLAAALDAMTRAVAVAQAKGSAMAQARSTFLLDKAPAQRYYRPSEPVVLFTGAAATPSDRYGQDGADDPDGLLTCAMAEFGGHVDTVAALLALRTRVAEAVDAMPEGFALRTYTGPSWHPVLLEWEAEFFPAAGKNNLSPLERDFHQDFVTGAYTLPAEDVELRPRSAIVPDKAANTYSGRTILSKAARPVLTARVLRYLSGTVLPLFNDAEALAGRPAVTAEEFSARPDAVLDWSDANVKDARLKTLMLIYRHLAVHQDSNLSQALGGFNDALLMLRLTPQLPVADPLGFPAGRELAAQVAAAVSGENRHAPQPVSDFNPIRAGALWISRLRILDNFGIAHDVDVTGLRGTSRLAVPGHSGWISMSPRLSQPARIVLRLLDAEGGTGPAGSSPICGWVMADNLDDSVRFSSASGDWLGSLYATRGPGVALWEPAPSGAGSALESIADPHLREVARWLRDRGGDQVGEFLATLDDSVAAIEPEDYAQRRGRAVLTGRPLAVVRAEVGLEAMEPPAVHQDWNVFRQDMSRTGRETNAFGRVRFPLRIGEHGRLEDGVAGYWRTDSAGGLGDAFHDMPSLASPGAESPVLTAIDLPPQRLTLLADPRAAIHATSGILPTAIATIPAEHYRDAIGRLEVGFLAAPVLTDAGGVALPLPSEPGAFWTWRQLGRAGWTQISSPPALRRADAPELDDAAWAALTGAGWLIPVDEETALVTPPGRRSPLPGSLASMGERIAALLDRPGIGTPRPDGPFPVRLTAREGWLALRSLPDPHPDPHADPHPDQGGR